MAGLEIIGLLTLLVVGTVVIVKVNSFVVMCLKLKKDIERLERNQVEMALALEDLEDRVENLTNRKKKQRKPNAKAATKNRSNK